jgi:hypothetical protein
VKSGKKQIRHKDLLGAGKKRRLPAKALAGLNVNNIPPE